MPIAGALLGGAAIGGLSSIFGAQTQANAAEQAAQLQYQESQNALGFEQNVWNTTQANQAPFLKAGQGAIGTLSSLLSTPGSGLLTPWTGSFTAPTAAQASATPGEQFEAQQGELALQNSAAASGGLLTGGFGKSITNYAEGLASTNYQQAFQNALTQYQTAYNTFQNNQTNTYNRLSGVAGTGQVSAAQLGAAGTQTGGTVGNIDLTAGGQIGQNINNAGAATASGYVGAGNAFQGGLSGLSGLMMLQQILNGGASASTTAAAPSLGAVNGAFLTPFEAQGGTLPLPQLPS